MMGYNRYKNTLKLSARQSKKKLGIQMLAVNAGSVWDPHPHREHLTCCAFQAVPPFSRNSTLLVVASSELVNQRTSVVKLKKLVGDRKGVRAAVRSSTWKT